MIFRGLKIEGDFLFYVLHVDGNGVVVVEPLCYLLGAARRPLQRVGMCGGMGEVNAKRKQGMCGGMASEHDERNALTGREKLV